MRRPLLSAYAVLSVADSLVALRGPRRLRILTKPALMPLLAAATGPGSDSRVTAGLGLSWAGDVALMRQGDAAFGVGLGSFLAAHVAYIAALRDRCAPAPWTRPLQAGYAAAWLALNAVLLPKAGKLRAPVFVYGTVLAGMAAAAAQTGDRALAAGGAAFLVSDSVLALNKFEAAKIPAASAVVMLTYTAAQALIATRSVSLPSRPST